VVCDSILRCRGGRLRRRDGKISGRGGIDRRVRGRRESFAVARPERKERRKESCVCPALWPTPFIANQTCTPGSVSAWRRKGRLRWPGFARGGKIAFGECCGASEEDEPGAFECAFFHRLDDGRLAACFSQRAATVSSSTNERSQLAKRLSFEEGF